jgi:protein O-GlcNAc transferase
LGKGEAGKKRKKKASQHQAASKPKPAELPGTGAQLLEQAGSLHQRGQLQEAEQLYRAALAADPSLVNGWRNLGAMLRGLGRPEDGCACTRQAVALDPNDASLLGNLGNVLRDLGQLEESEQTFRRALELEPGNGGLLLGLAITWGRQRRFQQVVQLLRPLLDKESPNGVRNGDRSSLYLELGNALHELGQKQEALRCWEAGGQGGEKRLQLDLNRAQTLCEQGDYAAAEQLCRDLEQSHPGNANVHYAIGVIARRRGDLEQAYHRFERALQLEPTYPLCLNTHGLLLRDLGRVHDARRCFERALQADPRFGAAMNNLGSVLKDVARYEEALQWLRRGAEAMGDNPGAHSNVLFTLVGYELEPAEQRFAEARRFAERFGKAPFERWRDRVPDPDPHRRLRIGLMSPDFCRHAVSYFIEPLLEQWDRRQLEITLYGCGEVRDDYTQRLQSKADHWRDLKGLTDEQAVGQIQRDEIDILVDLAGHTAGNRLALMAQKAAPIQATYLGYYGTTGLDQVDYWITDGVLHPPQDDSADPCSEQRWRLPRSYVSFRPLPTAPELMDPPCLKQEVVTFGSFNQSRKITPTTAKHWMAVLNAISHSRLLLKSRNLGEPSEAERVRDLFRGLGLAPERLELLGHAASLEEHLGTYNQVDIALDTFPYTGCTTTADALWMGVPVLSVAGTSMVSRQAASVLAAAGHPEWICHSHEEIVAAAQRLLEDRPLLQTLRREQRQRLLKSELLDHRGLAAAMAAMFREWWHVWLQQQGWNGAGQPAWPPRRPEAPEQRPVPLANSPVHGLPLRLKPTAAGQQQLALEALPLVPAAGWTAAQVWKQRFELEVVTEHQPAAATLDSPDAQARRLAWWNWLYPQMPVVKK